MNLEVVTATARSAALAWLWAKRGDRVRHDLRHGQRLLLGELGGGPTNSTEVVFVD
jgi:hypothetical protein